MADYATATARRDASRSEAMAILVRTDEGFDHLRVDIVSIEAVQLIQPKVVALVVERRLGRVVGIPAQVSEVLHQDKRAVELLLIQSRILSHVAQRS